MLQAVLAGAAFGFLSLPHCAAMCGPLSAFACSRVAQRAPVLRYQVGRTLGYTFLGAVSGHVGRVFQVSGDPRVLSLLFAASTALACVLIARALLAGMRKAQPTLVPLRTTRAQPERFSLFSALLDLLPRDPFFFGLSSAVLPCGVLAAALLSAVATADGTRGALLMLGFVTVSALVPFGAQFVLRRLSLPSSRIARYGAAAALVVVACLMLSRPLLMFVSPTPTPSHAEAGALHCH